jgi:hypothetical protein
MTLELLTYILLIFIASFAVFTNKNNIIKFLYIPLYVVFLVIIRNSGFDTDIQAYSEYMHYFSFYMIREFVFYGIMYQLYNLLENEILTFLIVDIIFFILLLINIKQLNSDKVNSSFILLSLVTLSFPFIMGIENIYRQLLASLLVLFAYNIRKKNEFYSNAFFLISLFFHNSMILFFPLLVLVKFFTLNLKSRLFITLLFLIIEIIFITGLLQGIITGGKSNVSTGLNLSYFYYLLFLTSSVFFIFKFNYKLRRYLILFPSALFAIFILFPLVFLSNGDSSAAERVGMTTIIIFIVELYNYSLTIKNKEKANLFRLLILLTFSLPTLVFSSARNFLLTTLG